MTKKCAPAVARIRDLHDLLGVIPHLLGFHPDESLVVLVVVDGQVQLTARADLGDLKPAGHLEVLLDRMVLRWPAAKVWLVGYCAVEKHGWRLLRRAGAAAQDALAGRAVVRVGRALPGWVTPTGRCTDTIRPGMASAASATLHRPAGATQPGGVARSTADEPSPFEAERSLVAALDRVATLDEAVLPGEMVAALDSALTALSRQSRDTWSGWRCSAQIPTPATGH